jgi:hypothetical protein
VAWLTVLWRWWWWLLQSPEQDAHPAAIHVLLRPGQLPVTVQSLEIQLEVFTEKWWAGRRMGLSKKVTRRLHVERLFVRCTLFGLWPVAPILMEVVV